MRFHGTWQLFIANDEAPPPCCVLPPSPGGIITATLVISGNDIEVASCVPDNNLHCCYLGGAEGSLDDPDDCVQEVSLQVRARIYAKKEGRRKERKKEKYMYKSREWAESRLERSFGINYRRVGSLGNLITRMKGEEGRRKVYPMLEFRSKQSSRDDQGVPV